MKRRLRWIGLISLLPIGVLAIFLAFMVTQETTASSALNRKLESMRQAGEPFDNDSMALYFEKHLHKEGTDAWSEVLALSKASLDISSANELPIVGPGQIPWELRPGSTWPDEPRVAEYMETVRPIIKRIQLASELPKPVWMPLRFGGYLTLFEPLQDSRMLTGILELDAVHATYHKQAERAIQDIVAMRSVADAFDWPWFLVAEYTSMAMLGRQWTTINRSLDYDLWNDEQLVILSAQVDKPFDIAKSWNDGLTGEIAMLCASLDNLPEGLPREMAANPFYRLPVMPSTRLEILRVVREFQDCADQGEKGFAERVKAVFASQMARNRLSVAGIYLSLFLPSVDQFARSSDSHETARRLTLTSLAVKRFQRKNNRWPKNLGELTDVGLVKSDWSTAKMDSLGYEIEDDRVFVWSFASANGSGVSETRHVWADEKDDRILRYCVSIR